MENKTLFSKGHVPWNKNKKGIHLSEKSEFKKGQKGIHWVPVGTIHFRIFHGQNRNFIKVKEPAIWTLYANFLWLKNNGEIPKGYVIHHIDFNPTNDVIDNLALLTRKAHFEIHKIGELGRQAIQDKITHA